MTRRDLSLIALMLAIAAGGSQQQAWAAEGAQTFNNWACVIDLEEALGETYSSSLPTKLETSDTSKLCTGGPSGNIMITCNASIPGWSGGAQQFSGFPCQVFRGQCGASGFTFTNNNSLKVLANGDATLTCKLVGAGE